MQEHVGIMWCDPEVRVQTECSMLLLSTDHGADNLIELVFFHRRALMGSLAVNLEGR